MDIYIILVTALLPIIVLGYYIYHKDKKSPEPTGQLVKAFLWGILSVPLSLCISIPLGLIGVYPTEATSILGSVSAAFFGAAIPVKSGLPNVTYKSPIYLHKTTIEMTQRVISIII